MHCIQVSKLDAACRQLESAIELFFADRDPVSIHTLAAAAYNLLADVCKATGARAPLRERTVLPFVKEDKVKFFERKLPRGGEFLQTRRSRPRRLPRIPAYSN